MKSLTQEFTEQCIVVIEKKNAPKLIRCLAELSEEQVWARPNQVSNSIGNLVLHLCGNIRQYIISGLGGEGDTRERELEFSAQGGPSKDQLIKKLTDTLAKAIAVIRAVDEKQMMANYRVQGMEHSGIGIILHVTEHFSHHTGQVIFWTKQLIDRDLGFYAHVDLNKKNGE